MISVSLFSLIGFLISLCILQGVINSLLPSIADASLIVARALPSSTLAVISAALDLGDVTARGSRLVEFELLCTAPPVSTSQLPDTKTFTYDIIHSDNADLSSPVNLGPAILVQTGAGGVGANSATARLRPPSNVKRYIGFRITPSASGTGDASSATATLHALF